MTVIWCLLKVWSGAWMMFISLWIVWLVLQSVSSTDNKLSGQNVNICKHDAYQPIRESSVVYIRMHLDIIPHEKKICHFLFVAALRDPCVTVIQKNIFGVIFTGSCADSRWATAGPPCSLCGVREQQGASQSVRTYRTTVTLLKVNSIMSRGT